MARASRRRRCSLDQRGRAARRSRAAGGCQPSIVGHLVLRHLDGGRDSRTARRCRRRRRCRESAARLASAGLRLRSESQGSTFQVTRRRQFRRLPRAQSQGPDGHWLGRAGRRRRGADLHQRHHRQPERRRAVARQLVGAGRSPGSAVSARQGRPRAVSLAAAPHVRADVRHAAALVARRAHRLPRRA